MAGERDDAADRLRIDRWLWCARLFKSRSAAAEAVRGGRVHLNGQRVKPVHPVKIGDTLEIGLRHGGSRDLAIASIPVRRGPATEAAQSYVETTESLERRRHAAEQRAAVGVFTPPTVGKPDKRTRRLMLRARRA
jgi:ribosome-associated heat shock protein Hsp15